MRAAFIGANSQFAYNSTVCPDVLFSVFSPDPWARYRTLQRRAAASLTGDLAG